MKNYFYIIVTLLTLSCSNEEENEILDNSIVETQTFLQKYDGFGFKREDNNVVEYYFFYDSQIFLKYVDIDTNDDESYCESTSEGSFTIDGNSLTITISKNDSKSLIVDIDAGGNNEKNEFTIDASGTTLTKTKRIGNDTEERIFSKTDTTFDFLCN
tara:strand:+ start:454 stop:924 length:471 start_codon:yes stop_codon:yes gene_type:complete